MRIVPTALLLITPIMQSATTSAATHAHQHGVAQMELIKLGADLRITVFASAADVIGFESRAQTSQQQQLIEQVEIRLVDGGKFFSFIGLQCSQLSQQSNLHEMHQVESSAPKQQREDEHEHVDVTMSYQFRCPELTTEFSVQLGLFAQFPALHKIQASWVTDKTQSSATLTAENNRLQLQ